MGASDSNDGGERESCSLSLRLRSSPLSRSVVPVCLLASALPVRSLSPPTLRPPPSSGVNTSGTERADELSQPAMLLDMLVMLLPSPPPPRGAEVTSAMFLILFAAAGDKLDESPSSTLSAISASLLCLSELFELEMLAVAAWVEQLEFNPLSVNSFGVVMACVVSWGEKRSATSAKCTCDRAIQLRNNPSSC